MKKQPKKSRFPYAQFGMIDPEEAIKAARAYFREASNEEIIKDLREWVPELARWLQEEDTVKKPKKKPKSHAMCCKCPKRATWVRATQFSGDHPFCDKHARMEEDFGKEDPSYFFWKEIVEYEKLLEEVKKRM